MFSSFLGSHLTSFSGDNGKATSAGFSYPKAVCSDKTGNLYIGGSNRLHKVDTSGIISMFAGTGTASSSGTVDGKATSISMSSPFNCVLDSSANLYLSTPNNYAIRFLAVSTKMLTRYAGKGTFVSGSTRTGDGGAATSATMIPQSIYLDTSGNIYIAESGGFRIRKIASGGNKIITNFAGSGVDSMTGMGGLATSATFPGANPYIAGDFMGNLFIASDKKLFLVSGSTNFISRYAGCCCSILY